MSLSDNPGGGGFQNPVATLLPGQVTTTDIADGAVTTIKVANLAITTAKIDALAVTSAKIGDLAVTTAKIDALAVTTAKIAALAVTDAKINDLSASKITAGTINTGTITVASLLGMASGSRIQFVRNGTARISTNDAPQNGDVWIEYRGNDAGAIIGLKKLAGVELVAGQINVGADGFQVTAGELEVTAGAQPLKLSTTADNEVVMILNTPRSWEFRQRGTGATTQLELWSTSDKDFYIGGDTIGQDKMLVRTGVNGSSTLFLDDALTDVGNHETLRLDRGTGGTLRAVGYFSSWAKTKTDIRPLSNSPHWRREWFKDIQTISSRKKRTTPYYRDLGYEMRTLSFLMDNLIQHTNLLTTKGERVGGEPDLQALLAVTVDYVQHLEERVTRLERAAA